MWSVSMVAISLSWLAIFSLKPGRRPGAADRDRVGVEHVRIAAVLVETVQFQVAGEGLGGLPQELQPPGEFLEGAEIVARAVIGIVDPLAALLVLEGCAHRERVRQGEIAGRFGDEGFARTVGREEIAITIRTRPDRIDLDDAGVGVAAEQ